MHMPEFESKITLGSVIQTAILVIGLTMAWSRLAPREEVYQEISKIRAESVTKEVNALQIQMLTLQVTALDKKVETMASDVKDIRRIVRQ